MKRKHLKDICLTSSFSFICSVGCILSQLLCSVKKLKQEVLLDQLFTSFINNHNIFTMIWLTILNEETFVNIFIWLQYYVTIMCNDF